VVAVVNHILEFSLSRVLVVCSKCFGSVAVRRLFKTEINLPFVHKSANFLSSAVTTTTKRLQLMCKNVQNFVHWMKEFVMIATSQTTTDNCRATYPDVRIVHPIKRDEPEAVEVSKQQVHLDSRQSNQQDQPTHNCTSGTNDPSDNKRDFFKLDDTFWTGSDSISVGRLSQGAPRSDYPPDVIESPDRYEKSDASLRVSQASETLCEKFEATALACSATCVRAGENNPTSPGSFSELSGQQREFETTYKTFGYSNDFSYNDSAIGSSGTTSVLQTDRVVAPAVLVGETSCPSLFGAIRSGGKSPERPAKSIRDTKEANFNTCEHKGTSQTGESQSFATDTVASSTTTDSLRTIEKPCGTTARNDVQGATSNKSTSAGYCDVKSGSIAAVSERKMNATLGAAFIRQATVIGKEKDTRSYQSDNASWQNASEADKMRSRAGSTLLGESFAVKSQPPLHATRPVSKEAKRDGRSGECESSLCGRSSVTVELKFGDRLSSPPPSVQKQSQPEAQPAVDRGREEGRSRRSERATSVLQATHDSHSVFAVLRQRMRAAINALSTRASSSDLEKSRFAYWATLIEQDRHLRSYVSDVFYHSVSFAFGEGLAL